MQVQPMKVAFPLSLVVFVISKVIFLVLEVLHFFGVLLNTTVTTPGFTLLSTPEILCLGLAISTTIVLKLLEPQFVA